MSCFHFAVVLYRMWFIFIKILIRTSLVSVSCQRTTKINYVLITQTTCRGALGCIWSLFTWSHQVIGPKFWTQPKRYQPKVNKLIKKNKQRSNSTWTWAQPDLVKVWSTQIGPNTGWTQTSQALILWCVSGFYLLMFIFFELVPYICKKHLHFFFPCSSFHFCLVLWWW